MDAIEGIYNATPPVLADGQQVEIQLDSSGRVLTSMIAKGSTTGGLSTARIVTGTTGAVKASAGQVYAFTAYNANAAVRYLHLYNKATAPTLSTDTPIMTIPLLGASVRDITITDIGVAFSTGIAWAYTTDDVAIPTTAGTSGELHATILYT